MLGAILGDIIGSSYEFDRGERTKDFELFTDYSTPTDDSIMTIALADALLSCNENDSDEDIQKVVIERMQAWGNRYPYAGYGSRFIHWLSDRDPKPYGSYGNGSAMRVSSAGWLYGSLAETRRMARLSAEVSHNHPEGIKGAECTASVIYLARTNHSMDEIKDYVEKEFAYDCSETLEQMRQRHRHVESCMDSLPKALRSFYDGASYEDVVRNAVSLGGDTDTIGAIAGSMAEAYFGIPDDLVDECLKRIPVSFKEVIDRYYEKIALIDER